MERLDRIEQTLEETAKEQAKTAKQIKALQRSIGGMQRTQGEIAEELVANSIKKAGFTLWGMSFDRMDRNLNRSNAKTGLECDIILPNSEVVVILEVKTYARLDDLDSFPSLLERFRMLFPEYQNCQVFLGLAALKINKRILEECQKKGYGVVKLSGKVLEEGTPPLKGF